MTETHRLEAQVRERAGKGAARRDRRAGRVPAVVYGAGKDPAMINLDPGTLDREMSKQGFFTRLYDIRVPGQRKRELALVRDLQLDPVTDRPIHLDFLRVSPKTEVTVNVPVHVIGEDDSPGLKRGGVLDMVRHDVEMLCRADNIPGYLEIDVSGLDINDSVHISMVDVPEGARPTIEDRDFTIASIAAPSGLKAEIAAEQAEAEEGEAEAEETGGGEGEESES